MSTIAPERTDLEKEIDAEVLERVKRGIALLQEEHGDGWVEKIDLKTLCLADGARCVLGQIYADKALEDYGDDDGWWSHPPHGYNWAMSNIEAFDQDPGGEDHGFCITDEEMEEDDSWAPLQEAWERVLTPLVTRIGH